VKEKAVNHFNAQKIKVNDIAIKAKRDKVNVIVAKDGDLFTGKEVLKASIKNQEIVADVNHDILKIVVVNRYTTAQPVVGLIKNFNLKKGAIAGSIAHDSHNIIAIGTNDDDIVNAINTIIETKGGIVACDKDDMEMLPLDVAGLMSREEAEQVAKKYDKVSQKAKDFGSKLNAPFMTMAFMALLVIPELKIGDKGLFDVSKFEFISLFHE
jgi:adenine deaminase